MKISIDLFKGDSLHHAKSRQKNSFSVVDTDFDKNSDDCADKNRVSLIGNFAQAYCFCYPDEVFFFYLNITI